MDYLIPGFGVAAYIMLLFWSAVDMLLGNKKGGGYVFFVLLWLTMSFVMLANDESPCMNFWGCQ